jgi:hypothetical protein
MAEAPKPSEIPHVLAMDDPQQMLAKLFWEIHELTDKMSVWIDNEEFPVAIFIAFNAVVTAWHITDWVWQSSPERRAAIAKRYGFAYAETETGIRKGLERFQEAISKECRALYVCREIANGSKHMRRKKADPDVKAKAEWHKSLEKVGVVNVGDYVMSMTITDGNEELDPVMWLIEAAGYLEKLFREEKWITNEKRLPDKIIRTPATPGMARPPHPHSAPSRPEQ